jgi:hypothetical protein
MDSRPTIRNLALVAITSFACTDEDVHTREVETPDDDSGDREADAPDGCFKTVHVHLANWSGADRLDDPRSPVPMNGCWTFDMAREYGHYWAHCKGAQNLGEVFPDTWIANWGSPSNWEDGAPKKWVYNETNPNHDPSDSERIDNCVEHLESHWGTPPARGYEYMMYRGGSGWFKSYNDAVRWSFAELYGPGTWWPHWNQWKDDPVGRPMAQIVDVQEGGNAHTVTSGMCDWITSGNWIGLYLPPSADALSYDSPAFYGIVTALNECTGGVAVPPSPEPPPPEPPPPEPPAPEPPPPEPGCGYMGPNGSLWRGQSLWSCDGRFVVTMQDDGNLVVYQDGNWLWASWTQGTDAQAAVMQDDGNFLVKDSGWNTLWSADTWGHGGAYVVMQDDGNLVVYENQYPLWASNTGGH